MFDDVDRNDGDHLTPLGADKGAARGTQIRNRWWLFATLARNPALQQYRRRAKPQQQQRNNSGLVEMASARDWQE